MRITFHGAVRSVTGSRHLLEVQGRRILLDCGLYQGRRFEAEKRNREFPFDPGEIDAVVLSHAHIDHSGNLPGLVKQGFHGPIHTTRATADLLEPMLLDSAHIQEYDVAFLNKRLARKKKPTVDPLYTRADAEKTLPLFAPHSYGEQFEVVPGVSVHFRDAGHILGSSFVEFKREDGAGSRKILFSGDFGRSDQPILNRPTQVFNVDYLVLESTYGDRLHKNGDMDAELVRVLIEGHQRGGVIVVPAFAVGRTQMLLYKIREYQEKGLIPDLQVFIDSPMAISTVDVFKHHLADLNLASRVEHLQGKPLFRPKNLHICKSREESIAINKIKSGAIIISASGMAVGGRILHHLAERLPDSRNTVLFAGYQAVGTRGRTIQEGKPSVKIHGQEVPVNAHVESIDSASGHGDYNEILAWLMGFNKAPERVFIVHGDNDASESLASKIRKQFGWKVVVPKLFESFEIDL